MELNGDINMILIGALQHCDTKELVEDTFKRFSITDNSQKQDHLVKVMGNPELFFSEGNERDTYSTVLSMFLTGEWKMNTLYEKMGY